MVGGGNFFYLMQDRTSFSFSLRDLGCSRFVVPDSLFQIPDFASFRFINERIPFSY